jgi:hypothetical protein
MDDQFMSRAASPSQTVIHRYVVHYENWARIDGPAIIKPITEKKVLSFCRNYAGSREDLYVFICDLRLALFELTDHLHQSSILEQHRDSSIYLAPIELLPDSGIPFSFKCLIEHITK